MTDLTQSCATISACLTQAQALIPVPDTDGTTSRSQPSSRPPWNPSAANAAMDAWEGLRRLEAAMHLHVHGNPGRRRGSSDANTQAAIRAIERLGAAVPTPAMTAAARILDRWARQIQQLPAIDQHEPWQRRPGMICPYCDIDMLRVKPKAGEVTCLRYGACSDSNGQHPHGWMDVSQLTGDGIIRWADGLVT